MDNQTDFQVFYDRVLRPEIARIEPLRGQTAMRLVAITVATVAAMVAWSLFAAFVLGWADNFIIWSLLIPIGIGYSIWRPIWKKYRDNYQLKLISAMIRLYNTSFSYDRDKAASQKAFTDCGLFPSALDSAEYVGTDRVTGKVGVTPFEFSDLDVWIPTRKHDIKIFKGVFFVADFNKNFSGETFVISRHSLRHPSSVPQTHSGEVVKLEDPEFEKAFATHSNSQIEARYILSPALMRRILDFGGHSKTPIAIAFRGTSLFIAMYHGSTRLEPVLWRTLQKPSLFYGIWANLEFLCGIVNDMDLNTRIWTKGA